MLNQVVLVGRLVASPTIEKTSTGRDYTIITVAVQRSFKNSDGVYETDFIRCVLWNGVASSTKSYCHKGDLVGIKGRLQVSSYLDTNSNKKTVMEVVAERVTFITKAVEAKDEQILEVDVN